MDSGVSLLNDVVIGLFTGAINPLGKGGRWGRRFVIRIGGNLS